MHNKGEVMTLELTAEEVVLRATKLANRIRKMRAKFEPHGELATINNITAVTVKYLQETRFFLDQGNLANATYFLTEAERSFPAW